MRASLPIGSRPSLRVGSLILALIAVGGMASSGQETGTKAEAGTRTADPFAGHERLILDDRFPSATACKTCHPEQYREWSVSGHAYTIVSPFFTALSSKLIKSTNGTLGDFCVRCHSPVAMQLGREVIAAALEREPVVREGVTCIVCHRRGENHGKFSGRFPIEEGDLFYPVYGPNGNDVLQEVLKEPDHGVITEARPVGRPIHRDARRFFPIVESGFCGTCHDVTVINGFHLEEAFSEYKSSPAAKNGITCQDCHMGQSPGVPDTYRSGPAAYIGAIGTRTRELHNHMFVGPDTSVLPPAVFPHNAELADQASLGEWLTFDWAAGWGTDAFEADVPPDASFPDRWATADDRYDGRELLEPQFELLREAHRARRDLLRVGYKLGRVEVQQADARALRFRVEVRSGTDGHNVPTGLTSERVVFLQVTVTDADGATVFLSGDLDPNGDLRDRHSLYVRNGELPLDGQLFNLQSKFVTRNLRGGERVEVLPINHSYDVLPFVRPPQYATVTKGRAEDARVHKRSIEPGGRRWAPYRVKSSRLTGKPPYTANVKLIAGMLPVNLVDAIKDVGFDYGGLSPRAVADAIVASQLVLWERDVVVEMAPREDR